MADRGNEFFKKELVNWTKKLGITPPPPTAHSPWANGKIETQNQQIVLYWRSFLNDAWNNWCSLAPKIGLGHNTNVNYTKRKTLYETVFATKPQISISLKPRVYRKEHELCCSCFYKDAFLRHFWDKNATSNESTLLLPKNVSSKLLDHIHRETETS